MKAFLIVAVIFIAILTNLRPLFGWMLPDRVDARVALNNCPEQDKEDGLCVLQGTVSHIPLSNDFQILTESGEIILLDSDNVAAMSWRAEAP